MIAAAGAVEDLNSVARFCTCLEISEGRESNNCCSMSFRMKSSMRSSMPAAGNGQPEFQNSKYCRGSQKFSYIRHLKFIMYIHHFMNFADVRTPLSVIILMKCH